MGREFDQGRDPGYRLIAAPTLGEWADELLAFERRMLLAGMAYSTMPEVRSVLAKLRVASGMWPDDNPGCRGVVFIAPMPASHDDAPSTLPAETVEIPGLGCFAVE